MPRLQGKVTIITGAAGGLGRVAALQFAREGSHIVVSDLIDGQAAVDEIKFAGGSAAYIHADVTSEDSWKEVVGFAKNTFGSVDVLYNNAGVMLGEDDDPVSTPMSVYERTMDINVKGVLLGCKYAIPHMIE